MGKVKDAIEILKAREASLAGDELKELLVGLGFEVKAGARGGHHVVTHDELNGFVSTSYDKGHNKHMLACYPRQIRKVLKQYESELERILGEDDG